jgi:hypothetical protein
MRIAVLVLLTALHAAAVHGAAAQTGGGALPSVHGPTADRARVDQLLGRAPTAGFLLRSPSALLDAPRADSARAQPPSPAPDSAAAPPDSAAAAADSVADAAATPLPRPMPVRVHAILPSVTAVRNSDLPVSMNDGLLWAGRGWNVLAAAGVRISAGPVTLVLAPQVAHSQNEAFFIFPGRDSTRSAFSSPWYAQGRSADLPLRFGNEAITVWDWGQSSIGVRAKGVVAGAATENQWWGPGYRNAIVLSNNAPGFPHLFVRTASPRRTLLGEVEAKWVLGGLTRSLYFDDDSSRDGRSFNGFIGTLRPADPITIGVARAVYARSSGGAIASHAFDFLFRGGSRVPAGDSVASRGGEQVTSVFARWVSPADGAEVYAEWARAALPGSPRDFLAAPNHTQGYTLGGQWARPAGRGAVWLQGELTYLEPSPTIRSRYTPGFYTSAAVVEGYTQRGQVLGAAIGPGSSSQWLGLDYMAPAWRVGVFGSRVRWHEDAHNLLRNPAGEQRRSRSHDVSVEAGVRGGLQLRGWDLSAQLGVSNRFNYLFQNPDVPYGLPENPGDISDIRNVTFQLGVTPAVRRN